MNNEHWIGTLAVHGANQLGYELILRGEGRLSLGDLIYIDYLNGVNPVTHKDTGIQLGFIVKAYNAETKRVELSPSIMPWGSYQTVPALAPDGALIRRYPKRSAK